ncbi:MAG: hypothetical protein AB7W28_12055 [Armatimonadota bacterium]
MHELQEVSHLARQVLDRLVERVCGVCERNCCHQGTMMGSQDLRRLVRALAVDAALADRLRKGLVEKACEVAADVAAARKVVELLRTSGTGQAQDLEVAEARIRELEQFRETLASGLSLDYEDLRRLMLHTALRHNLLRALSVLPGGHTALARFAGDESSFRFRGRRIAPPRCIFHSRTVGCLAGRWKPAKCANFFCTADPSLLDAIHSHMDFDDFVLAAFDPITWQRLLELLDAEARLGPEYHEPMVVVGLGDEHRHELADRLNRAGVHTRLQQGIGGTLWAADVERLGQEIPRGEGLLLVLPELSAADLYELALGLDRLRQANEQRLLLVAPAVYVTPSRPPHPMWTEHTMSQPIGYLECYLLAEDSQGAGSLACKP